MKIRLLPAATCHEVPFGCRLDEIAEVLGLPEREAFTSALVNNKTEGLQFRLCEDCDVRFLTVRDASGLRTYTRTLFFVLYRALRNLFPQAEVTIGSPVSNGYYCYFRGLPEKVPSEATVEALKREMRRIVSLDLPIVRHTCPTPEAIARFESQGLHRKVRLMESSGRLYTTFYTLEGVRSSELSGYEVMAGATSDEEANNLVTSKLKTQNSASASDELADYYYGCLLPTTGRLKVFGLVQFADGCLLRVPDPQNPESLRPMREQPKMFDIFRQQHAWQDLVGISTVGEFNDAVEKGYASQVINISEALQEKRIAALATEIAADAEKRVVLIAGPSSSGKTTFCKRLSVQLACCGIRPLGISLDDYFIDRDKTPRLPNGEYDYENVRAVNIPLFNEHINALLRGEEIELPRYDFVSGRNVPSGNRMRLAEGSVLVIEGIHALNPLFSAQIPRRHIYKIYASALTTIQLDDHNYIPTTDNRLLRRIVRDFKYRGRSALETIHSWPAVRDGEEQWIFPYQEEADAMVNTALLFEIAALRDQALPLLEAVPENVPEHAEAYRLRKFLTYFRPIDAGALPPTSLLREFLGGSTFKY